MHTIIIPEILQPIASILSQYLQPLLSWASQYILQQLVAKYPHHPLVRLQSLLDFSELERACAGYHQPGGSRGRPVSHRVPQLLRLLFVRYWYDLGLRRTEEQLCFNLLVRWFVGYDLHEAVADHTTLHRFEAYLYTHHRSLFFDTILCQIDALLDDGHSQVQIGDTFALRACAAMETIIQRLRHSSYQLLLAWKEDDPTGYAAAQPQIDNAALFGLKTEKREFFLAREEWLGRLRLTVQAIEELLALLPPDSQRCLAVLQRQAQLQKIMADELTMVRDENGRITSVSFLPPKKRGHFRVASATDPEATIRNHGEGKKDFGYNISVAATPDFIRAIQADTGSTSDVTPIPDLLRTQAERADTLPQKLIYDQVAGHGKTAHEVTQVSQGQTQLVAYPMPLKETNRFGPEDFSLSEDGLWLTCPDGRIINRRYRSGSGPRVGGEGWTFRFLPAQCLGCPLLSACRGSTQTPTTHRDVFISDYRPDYDRLVAYAKTDDFKQDMKLRPQIERVIAGLVLHNGARHARFRGRLKVDFQVKMAATIYNARHWLVRLDEIAGRRRRPVRRRWQVPAPSQA
jgi:transposase